LYKILIAKISATAAKKKKTAKITTVEKIGENFFEKYRVWGLYVYTGASAHAPKRTLQRRFLHTCAVLPYFSAFYNWLSINELSPIGCSAGVGVCIYVWFWFTEGSPIWLGDNSHPTI
tara:strand:- start:82 stop:435 length:354 start_codon:yes stop_codon:yes gene_type:complete